MNKFSPLKAVLAIAFFGANAASGATDIPQLINFSVRAFASGTSANELHAGFVIGGPRVKTVVIRVVGPTLADPTFGVPGTMPDPELAVYNSESREIARNDDWAATDANKLAMLQAGAYAIAAGGKDAAVVLDLPPGAYTITAKPKGNTPAGVCQVEVYDLSYQRGQNRNVGSEIFNASIRLAGSTGSPIILGVIFAGDGVRNLLVRAAGPSLAAFGVTNVMANPRLLLLEKTPTGTVVLGRNSGWSTGNATWATFDQVGAFRFPANSMDSALVAPVTVKGPTRRDVFIEDNGNGNALAELYVIQNR
ncbi:MAG TPA: hypothetical protein VGE35_00845 [Candidatus Paceibacterota bacterium]